MKHDTPYLEVVDMPRKMSGRGAPRDTVFGVLGHTMFDPMTRSLGGLVKDSKASAPAPPTMKATSKEAVTEHKIAGAPAKTKIPGAHYAMSPYPGRFMSEEGKRLS